MQDPCRQGSFEQQLQPTTPPCFNANRALPPPPPGATWGCCPAAALQAFTVATLLKRL